MRKIYCCVIIFFLFRDFATAQYCAAGAEAMALCGASMPIGEVWAVYNNPASLVSLSDFAAGVSSTSAFVPQLNKTAIATAVPVKGYVFAFCYDHFGFSLYHAHHIAFASAAKFSPLFAGALKFNYFSTITQGYQILHQSAFEMALNVNISSKLLLCSHIYNPVPIKVRGEVLPSFIRLSASYAVSSTLLMTGEVEQAILAQLRIKMAGLYALKDVITIGWGYALNPTEIAFGVGWKGLRYNNIKYNIAMNYTMKLGFSSQVSLIYTLKK